MAALGLRDRSIEIWFVEWLWRSGFACRRTTSGRTGDRAAVEIGLSVAGGNPRSPIPSPHGLIEHFGVGNTPPVEYALFLDLDHCGHGAHFADGALERATLTWSPDCNRWRGIVAREDAADHVAAAESECEGKTNRQRTEGNEDHVLQQLQVHA